MSLEAVLSRLHQGHSVLLEDDTSLRRTGFIVAPAEGITDEEIAFMVNEARGLVCAALPELRANELGLPLMVRKADESLPAFTVSVEARQGVTTGISCADRAETLRTLARTTDVKRDLVMPGHVFPLLSRSGGVLVKGGVPEAAVDLLNLAGLTPVAALCQCLAESGDLAGTADLDRLCAEHSLPRARLSEIIEARLAKEIIIERIADAKLPTVHGGEFRAVAFRSLIDDAEHLVLLKGAIANEAPTFPVERPILVRVHAENRLGDLLGTEHWPTRTQIGGALRSISEAGEGVFVYVRHSRRALLAQQISDALSRQNQPLPHTDTTVQQPLQLPVLREYGIGSQILRDLGVRKIRLLTNSSRDIPSLEVFGLEIVERVPFEPSAGGVNCEQAELSAASVEERVANG